MAEVERRWAGFNRTLCSVFEEMRKAYETRNFNYLPGLIEEAQSMGNRMESALADRDDIRCWEEERELLKIEIKSLRTQAGRDPKSGDKTDESTTLPGE